MFSLLEVASDLAGTSVAETMALARLVTASQGAAPVGRGHSGLNHDGTPLQLCVTVDRQGSRYRLLGDPAADQADMDQRLRLSLAALQELLPRAGALALEPSIRTTLADLVGDEQGFDAARHPDGVMWLAGALRGPGLALYVDARNGGIDTQQRLRRWLEALVRPSDDVEALLAAVNAGRVMSAGVEGVAPGYARAKIYWRLPRPEPLSLSPLELFADEAFTRTIGQILGDREIHLDGVVLNAGLAIPDGRLVDAKVDICCCPRCVPLGHDDAVQIGAKLAQLHSLPEPALARLAETAELAFIGFGLTRTREARLNFYFKPRSGGQGAPHHGPNYLQ